MLPPERRIPSISTLVDRENYFGVRAPRQTGKTTAMRAFGARLRAQGYAAVYATLETSQGFVSVEEAEPLWIDALSYAAEGQLPVELRPLAVADGPAGARLQRWLGRWCEAVAPRKVVLLLDEADVIEGPALVSLLRQLRAGFIERPDRFPASIALIGMRELRDYLARDATGAPVSPGSPFNIKSDSLTLRSFTEAEVAELYGQHTADTGQAFTPEAIGRAWCMAFLQRVVNGGGRVIREYAAGRKALDLVVEYGDDRFVIEIKRVRPRDAVDTVAAAAVTQVCGYLDTVGAREGWVLLFDQHVGRSWEERLWRRTVEVDGAHVHLYGA